MSNVFQKLEDEAGHELTLISGPLAGVSTYWCENCGAVAFIRGDNLDIFQVPATSRLEETCCLRDRPCGHPYGPEGKAPPLKDKLDQKSHLKPSD